MEFAVKLKTWLDIIQSLVLIIATIVGGIWVLKTFGYDERLRQLEKLNRSVLSLKAVISNLRMARLLSSAPNSPSFTERYLFKAQEELKELFDATMRIDFLKKFEWQVLLLQHMYRFPPDFSEKDYEEAERDFSKVSAEIVKEGHFGLPKWLRWLLSLFTR